MDKDLKGKEQKRKRDEEMQMEKNSKKKTLRCCASEKFRVENVCVPGRVWLVR